jgi:hypothetical protein
MSQEFLDILIKWANLNVNYVSNYNDEFSFHQLADHLISDGVDILHPSLIQNFYEITKMTWGVWFTGTKQINYLLAKGANPTTLLNNLWKSEPVYIDKYPEYCLIRQLLQAGAKLDSQVLLMKYICNPWEFTPKMDVILCPLAYDLTYDRVKKMVADMFQEPNRYILDFLISQGLNPNIYNGDILKRSINDYLCLMCLAIHSPPVFFERYTVNSMEEEDVMKLSLMTLIILMKHMSFKYIARAYVYIDTIQPKHANYNMENIYITPYRDHIKTLIQVIRPNVLHLRTWASLIIQRAWRKANTNPDYYLCKQRLQKEFADLNGDA